MNVSNNSSIAAWTPCTVCSTNLTPVSGHAPISSTGGFPHLLTWRYMRGFLPPWLGTRTVGDAPPWHPAGRAINVALHRVGASSLPVAPCGSVPLFGVIGKESFFPKRTQIFCESAFPFLDFPLWGERGLSWPE